MANPKVIIFIDWYAPGFKAGGPIQSMINMMDQLKDEVDFYVITSNHDYNDSIPYDLPVREWISRKEAQVIYLDAQGEKADFIRQLVQEIKPNIIYVNGIFSRIYSQLPLKIAKQLRMEERLIIAPRGMLAAGARSVKPLKKNAFFVFQKIKRNYKSISFHASSEQEQIDISKVLGKVKSVVLIENLPRRIKPLDRKHEKVANSLNIICLSRISPEKNIHFAISQLSKIKTDFNINYDIYGTVNDTAYMAECESLVRQLPSHITVSFHSAIEGNQLKTVFSEAELFFLPTLGENYGHAIVESLAFSCPVLISDKTAWKNLEHSKAGFDLSLAQENEFREKIEKLASMAEEEYISYRVGARSYFESHVNTSKLRNKYLQLFSM